MEYLWIERRLLEMKNSHLLAIVYGWITIFILLLLSSVFLSILMKFVNITEFMLSYLALSIGILSLLIGGIVTGMKGKEKGLVIGALTGIGFTVLTFLIQYLGYNQTFTMEQSIYHLAYIIAAMIGSIIGVNLSTSRKTT